MTVKTIWAATALVLLGSAALPATAAPSDNTVNCMMPVWPGFAPVYLANQLGYFQQEGVKVTEKFDDDRTDALAAFTSGSINCYLRTVGEYQGRPFTPEAVGTIIGTIDMSLGGDGVAAAGDIHTPADLKGKVVAAEPNVPGRLILQAARLGYDSSAEGFAAERLALSQLSGTAAPPESVVSGLLRQSAMANQTR